MKDYFPKDFDDMMKKFSSQQNAAYDLLIDVADVVAEKIAEKTAEIEKREEEQRYFTIDDLADAEEIKDPQYWEKFIEELTGADFDDFQTATWSCLNNTYVQEEIAERLKNPQKPSQRETYKLYDIYDWGLEEEVRDTAHKAFLKFLFDRDTWDVTIDMEHGRHEYVLSSFFADVTVRLKPYEDFCEKSVYVEIAENRAQELFDEVVPAGWREEIESVFFICKEKPFEEVFMDSIKMALEDMDFTQFNTITEGAYKEQQ